MSEEQAAAEIAVIAEVLDRHYATGGWAPEGGMPGKPGRWKCSCGRGGPVPNGGRVVGYHRAHLARAIASSLAVLHEAAARETDQAAEVAASEGVSK